MSENFSKIKTIMSTNNKYELYFQRYFYYLYNLAISRFKWVNLPKEIDPRFLEDCLFWQGQALFFQDDVTKLYAVMKTALAGNVDIYDYPTMRTAYSYGYMENYDKSNSVLLHDSMTEYPASDYLGMHAHALAEMRLSRDINIVATRTPVIVAGNANQGLTKKNVMKQIAAGIPFINLNKDIYNKEDIVALKTDAPITFNELNASMRWEISEACNYLGIDSFNTSKKERSVSAEARGNNGEMEMNRKSALMVRERSCEQINRMFGLDLQVEFNSDIPIVEENSEESMEENREESME